MKTCAADAGILLLLATLLTNISTVFAQSNLNDTLQLSLSGVHQGFEFENVANRLSELTAISIPFVEEESSLGQRLSATMMRDLTNSHGHIDVGYSYGLNTVFIDTSRSIGSIFRTSGNFSSAIGGVPINVSFNYSSLRVPLGTNNYFRFSLDKERLVQQQKEKLSGSISKLDKQQASLQNRKAELTGIMGYLEVKLEQLKRLAVREGLQQRKALSERLGDSISGRKPVLPDTLQRKPLDYQLYYDSLTKIYSRIVAAQGKIDSLTANIDVAKEKLASYQSMLASPALPGTSFNKFNLLQSIRTLDVGLSYPKTTAMSGQNVPIKGLHLEIQHRKFYLSVASGLTLNNLMLSTNEIQNKLNYNQNVFNNFDFQQIRKNGWLTAIKSGYGTIDGTHAFVGFNYLSNTRFVDPGTPVDQQGYDPAASLELDLRYVPKFLKGSALDVVYGKTSINRQVDTVTEMRVFPSLFSSYSSNLLLTRYTQNINRLRSDLSLTYRRIDPYVNTSTFGMMQPNNQRMEVKTNHRLSKFVKLGLLYRLEETLRMLAGTNHLRLNVSGANVSGNYTSYFSYSVFVNHIQHRFRLPGTGAVNRGNNYLFGTSLVSTYDLGTLKSSSVLTYNDYLITDSLTLSKYTQFGLMQSIFDKRYTAGISYDYFFRNTEGVVSGTNVFGLSGKYNFTKIKLGAGLKLASDFLSSSSMGGHVEAIWAANKFLEVNVRAERFVLGDFYRNYYRSQYEQFPYLLTLQTRFKL